MKRVLPETHTVAHAARRPAARTSARPPTPYQRSHALMTRMAVMLSLVFALAMAMSHVSRPAPTGAPAAHPPVR